jgi:hypothetical protein
MMPAVPGQHRTLIRIYSKQAQSRREVLEKAGLKIRLALRGGAIRLLFVSSTAEGLQALAGAAPTGSLIPSPHLIAHQPGLHLQGDVRQGKAPGTQGIPNEPQLPWLAAPQLGVPGFENSFHGGEGTTEETGTGACHEALHLAGVFLSGCESHTKPFCYERVEGSTANSGRLRHPASGRWPHRQHREG